jgi:hypothetical protein
LAIWFQTPRQEALTRAAVLEEATRLFAIQPSDPGYLLAKGPCPPADYPPSHDVLTPPGTHWRWVADFLGGKALALDLPGAGGARATLYIARRTVHDVPSLPPDCPTPMTAGRQAGAWQQDETLYVLVVDGDARAYRSFLDLSRGPLA